MLQGTYVVNNPFMWTADDKFFEAALATRLGVASPKTVVLPAILKDAHGGGWKEVYRVNSVGELLAHFDHSGLLTMVLQEFIEWDTYVRCMALGQQEVLVMQYDPNNRRYMQ